MNQTVSGHLGKIQHANARIENTEKISVFSVGNFPAMLSFRNILCRILPGISAYVKKNQTA